MRAQKFGLIVVGYLCLVAGSPLTVHGTDYYVAPGGLDTNTGTIGSPFATIPTAITAATAGDTIFLRGGTYNIANKITIASKSGTADKPIRLWAYPGEAPILDFAGQDYNSSNRGIQINNSANYWQLSGLTIQNAGDNGLYTEGDYGVFERIVTRYNRDSGFQLHTSASYNLVLNCDSYENYDPETGNTTMRGENADGFAVKSPTVGPGNIFRGDRSFRNSDDGWDMFEARANGVLIENSWSYDNGYDPHPDAPGPFGGDGNGYKLGHDSGSHVLDRVVAWDNPQNGIDINGDGFMYNGNTPTSPNGNLSKVLNSTAYNNGLASGGNFRFDENLGHSLRNNISFEGGVLIALKVLQQLNTWNGFNVGEDDFISLDDSIARGPRQADGSLPVSGFLHLASDTSLRDVGTPIFYSFGGRTYQIPYNGDSPDLGAFEYTNIAAALAGDFNGDHAVDLADYAAWRRGLGTTFTQTDYDTWKAHFGQTSSGGGATGGGTAVPEPTTLLLMAVAGVVALSRSRARAQLSC